MEERCDLTSPVAELLWLLHGEQAVGGKGRGRRAGGRPGVVGA